MTNSINATQMWSMYLFNQMTPKTGVDLLDESIIRNNQMIMNSKNQAVASQVQSDVITLSAKDFMETGAGRFVNGANFGVVQNFFSDNKLVDQFMRLLQNPIFSITRHSERK